MDVIGDINFSSCYDSVPRVRNPALLPIFLKFKGSNKNGQKHKHDTRHN